LIGRYVSELYILRQKPKLSASDIPRLRMLRKLLDGFNKRRM
jgi:hypothetical protein